MSSIYATLIVLVIALTQLLFGGGDGTRLIYVLPGYSLLGILGLLTLISFRRAARIDRWCLVSGTILAAYFLIRTALSPVAYLATFDFFAILSALIIYFVSAVFVTRQNQRLGIIASLFVLGLCQVALGVFQFSKSAGFNPFITGDRGDAGLRAAGLFISPNHLAGFLEVLILLGAALIFWSGLRTWARIVIGYFTLVCLAGIVLTQSRGGYLSVTAGFVVFALLSIWTARSTLSEGTGRRILAVLVAVALIGGGIAFVVNRNSAIRQRASTVFVSEDVRLSLWQAALKQFQLEPVFGTGSRTYAYYGRRFRAPGFVTDPVFAHSDYLQALAEYGLVGAALLAAFLFAHLRHSGRMWLAATKDYSPEFTSRPDKTRIALQIGGISALAACLVHAAMDFNLHIPANLLLTAWLLGSLATSDRDSEPGTSPLLTRASAAIPATLGLWILIVGAPRLPAELYVEIARGKFAAGQPAPAVQDAARAMAYGARSPELYFQIGEAQRLMSKHHRSPAARMGALEEAADAYAEALAIYPKDVKILLPAAWTLDKLERYDEAEQLLARARELDPNLATVWIFSALHWRMQNKPAQALADYRKAVELGAGMIPWVLAELDDKIDAAELEKKAAGN